MINKKTNTENLSIHAYKFNGWLYRTWEFPKKIIGDSECVCFLTNNSRVITADKKKPGVYHHSKTPPNSVWFFFKNEWFNIRFFYKNNAYGCYINVSSPYLIEDDTIKYIDLDIDYEINDMHNPKFKELDVVEHAVNAEKYKYPEKLIVKIKEAQNKIKVLYANGKIKELFNRYQALTNNHE